MKEFWKNSLKNFVVPLLGATIAAILIVAAIVWIAPSSTKQSKDNKKEFANADYSTHYRICTLDQSTILGSGGVTLLVEGYLAYNVKGNTIDLSIKVDDNTYKYMTIDVSDSATYTIVQVDGDVPYNKKYIIDYYSSTTLAEDGLK